jgi:hypothetical protein
MIQKERGWRIAFSAEQPSGKRREILRKYRGRAEMERGVRTRSFPWVQVMIAAAVKDEMRKVSDGGKIAAMILSLGVSAGRRSAVAKMTVRRSSWLITEQGCSGNSSDGTKSPWMAGAMGAGICRGGWWCKKSGRSGA